ncbi:hypothetical protein E2C01_083426 [Portunus trituberculatus]|uniref:Uncharacterized protein n=1 Tax=Portunus trituberculatus TaxID=210409 RepID=A0A5B7IV51_PORTR|nr:hypothetical protein [Portunus trituberculatus]
MPGSHLATPSGYTSTEGVQEPDTRVTNCPALAPKCSLNLQPSLPSCGTGAVSSEASRG